MARRQPDRVGEAVAAYGEPADVARRPGPVASGSPPASLGSLISDAGASPYGWRWVEERAADGSTRWREVPLAWEDLFDPQEGDVMVHGTLHGRIVRTTAVLLQHWFDSTGSGDVLVTDDVKMLWGLPGVSDVGPDIAVVFGVRDPSSLRGSFEVAEEGTRPGLVIEAVSKSTRKFDYEEKPAIYERAGVEECLFVDPLQKPWTLSGLRRGLEGSYEPIELDAGWLPSESTGLRFRVGEDGASLVVEDAASGQRLRDLSEEALARRAAELEAARQEAAREEAERLAARAEAEKRVLEEELARLRRQLESPNG